jgi:hypothetical protein
MGESFPTQDINYLEALAGTDLEIMKYVQHNNLPKNTDLTIKQL